MQVQKLNFKLYVVEFRSNYSDNSPADYSIIMFPAKMKKQDQLTFVLGMTLVSAGPVSVWRDPGLMSPGSSTSPGPGTPTPPGDTVIKVGVYKLFLPPPLMYIQDENKPQLVLLIVLESYFIFIYLFSSLDRVAHCLVLVRQLHLYTLYISGPFNTYI